MFSSETQSACHSLINGRVLCRDHRNQDTHADLDTIGAPTIRHCRRSACLSFGAVTQVCYHMQPNNGGITLSTHFALPTSVRQRRAGGNEQLSLVQNEWRPGDSQHLCQCVDTCPCRRSAEAHICTANGSCQGDQELLPADIRGLPICFPAVSDAEYSHGLFAPINLLDDSIVSDSNPPVVLRAAELATSWRPRVLGKSKDARNDTMEGLHWKPLQITLRCPFEVNLIHSGDTPPGNPLVS